MYLLCCKILYIILCSKFIYNNLSCVFDLYDIFYSLLLIYILTYRYYIYITDYTLYFNNACVHILNIEKYINKIVNLPSTEKIKNNEYAYNSYDEQLSIITNISSLLFNLIYLILCTAVNLIFKIIS